MSYQVISNFQGGLDARKYLLSLPPGTLTKLVNAHITQGAEMEKRKAFVPFALPANTFGAQETPTGILVFGTIAPPTITQPPGTTVSYQQLTHPSGSAMTGVLWSTLFGTAAWVIASFADGSVYEYYAGTIIGDFRNGGRQINFTSNATIAASLVALINASGAAYTAAQVGSTAVFTVTAAAGSNFNVDETVVSAAGTLTPQFQNAAIDGTAGTPALGSFQIMAGQLAFASAVLDNNGQPANGNTRTINGVVYTFVSAIGTTAGNVLIDSTALLTQTNFQNAINGGAGAGTKYINTTVHPNASVTAAAPVSGTSPHVSVTITAKISGTGGNYNLSSVGTNLTGPATLTGGDASGITQVTVATGTALLLGPVDFVTDVPTFAAAVVTAINANGASGYTASATGAIITLFSAIGITANGAQTAVTAKGSVCIGNCQFILSGTGFTLSALAVNGTSILPASMLFPQPSGQTLAQFMAAAAAAVNTLTASTGYLAAFNSGTLFVSKALTTSSDAPLTVTGTVTPTASPAGTGAITSPGNTVVLATASPASLSLITFASPATTDAPAVATATGGVPPYTYLWTLTDDTQNAFAAANPTAASTAFIVKNQKAVTKASGFVHAQCKVTDYAGNFGLTGLVEIHYSLF